MSPKGRVDELEPPLDRSRELEEAYIKAVGLGLSYPLERFTVSLAPDAPARLETVEAEPGHVEGWTMAALAPRSGFVGAVVVGARPVDVVCERWGEDRR